MKVDITRSTFRPDRRYSGVRMLQGRVQVDADWNEELDILAHVERTTGADVIGQAGVPRGAAEGFGIGTGIAGDLTISPGRIYVDGVLVELRATPTPAGGLTTTQVTLDSLDLDGVELAPPQWLELSAPGAGPFPVQVTHVDVANRVITFAPALTAAQVTAFSNAGSGSGRRVTTFLTQPTLPGAQFADGTYLAYLDVWERAVTSLEDPDLREVALGGPDTTARTQVVGQVKLLPVTAAELASGCGADFPEWDVLTAPPGDRLAARAQPEGDSGDCLLPASAGFRRLENQLYRVEVHQTGALGTATWKWSRENGSVVRAWLQQPAANQVVVSSTGPDTALGFANGDFVELTDDSHELRGMPGVIVQLTGIQDTTLTFTGGPVSIADFPLNPKARRWESDAATVQVPATNGGWVPLESGVEVRFAAGTYRTGDYWLIPARTATADVEWPRDSLGGPLPQPPRGVVHRYARLALLTKAGATVTATDCRRRFPGLTTICADDVCYTGTCTDAGGNVKAAIDFLCQERDLRFHNQHLHGTGIVCGLQVQCDFDQGQAGAVQVLPGYAIECDGTDRNLNAGRVVPVVQLAEAQDAHAPPGSTPILDGTHSGEAALYLVGDPARPDGVGFAVERFDGSQDTPQAALEGTLLRDFAEDCVQPLLDFWRKETQPTNPNAPDSPQDHLRTALVDLAAQVVSPAGGQRIFVSRAEHQLLAKFYADLRALLESRTFCAMFANARPFPDYMTLGQLAAGLDTVFAKGEHVRLRLRPGGFEAFSVGPGLNPVVPSTTLNHYDLQKNQLIDVVDPLAGVSLPHGTTTSGAGAVQDVAFSADGNQIYVIVPARDGRDTFFRVGVIAGSTITWGAISVICGVKLMTLATTPADPKFVYAAGLGKGIYRIDPTNVVANQNPLVAFNAVGHLEIKGGLAVATAAAAGVTNPASYTSVVQVQVPAGTQSPAAISLPVGGSDGLVLYSAALDGARRDTVYVAVGPDSGGIKHVLAFDSQTSAAVTTGTPPSPVDLPVMNTGLGLALFPTRSTLLVALADDFSLRVADLTTNTWAVANVLPLQVAPTWVAVDAKRQFAYVLNFASNSVSTIDGTGPRLSAQADTTKDLLPALAGYRQQALDAFADLLGGTAQYLKDCFCDLLLVQPPACTPRNQKLYLAGVKIVNGAVYRICNFAKRHYVKSFPTVGYWLSIVPVVPLVGWLFKELCCLVLPEQTGKYAAPGYTAPVAPNLTHDPAWATTLRQAITGVQGQDLASQLLGLLARGSILPSMVSTALAHPGGLRLPLQPPATAVAGGWAIVNQPADSAQATLTHGGVLVRREAYDPASANALPAALDAFSDPPPGSQVTLYEQDGVVRYYRIQPAAPAADLTEHVATLSTQLAAKDAQVKDLQGQLQALQTQQAELQRVQAQQAEIIKRIPIPPVPPAPHGPPPPPAPPGTPGEDQPPQRGTRRRRPSR